MDGGFAMRMKSLNFLKHVVAVGANTAEEEAHFQIGISIAALALRSPTSSP
jgi:hypothetical protein